MSCDVSTPTLHTVQSPSSTTTKCCKASKKYIPCRNSFFFAFLQKTEKSEFHPRPFSSSTPKPVLFISGGKKDDNNMAAVCNVKYADATAAVVLMLISHQKNTLYTFYFAYSEKTVLSFPPDFFHEKKLCTFYISFCYHIAKKIPAIHIAPNQKISLQKTYFL